jgi:hypothetical protein
MQSEFHSPIPVVRDRQQWVNFGLRDRRLIWPVLSGDLVSVRPAEVRSIDMASQELPLDDALYASVNRMQMGRVCDGHRINPLMDFTFARV